MQQGWTSGALVTSYYYTIQLLEAAMRENDEKDEYKIALGKLFHQDNAH